jgi:4-hydroxybenzoate polyprenyltransferase
MSTEGISLLLFNRNMKKFFDFILYSNVFISLCAVLMSLETYLLLNIKITFQAAIPLIPIIFLSTLFVYNLDLFGINSNIQKEGSSERQVWRISNIGKIRNFNTFLAILIALLSLFSSLKSFLFFVHLAIISIAYYLSFKIGSAKFTSLRSIPFLKAFIITYVWTASTVLLPAIKNEIQLFDNRDVLMVFAERYLFLFALAIIFDIRDIKDDKKNIRTIPGTFGTTGTKAISVSLLFINIYLAFIHYNNDLYLLFPILASIILAALFICRANSFSSEYYFLGLLDGSMAFQFILLIMFYLLFKR